MQKLFNLLTKIQSLSQTELLKKVLKDKEVKKLILDLNRIDQLYDFGIDSNNKSLGEYAVSTILGTAKFKGKLEKGQPIDRVTLKDTGDFYASFDINENFEGIEITAKDPNDLLGRYGEDILGLTEDNLQEALQYIRGKILQLIEEKITTLLD